MTLLFCCIFIILQLCFSYSISALFCISFLSFHILLIFKYFSYPLTVVFAWNFISFWFSFFNFFHFLFWHIISFHTISSFLYPDIHRNTPILPWTMGTELPTRGSVQIQWSNLPNTSPTTVRQIFFCRWTRRRQGRFKNLRVYYHQLLCLRW